MSNISDFGLKNNIRHMVSRGGGWVCVAGAMTPLKFSTTRSQTVHLLRTI